MEDMMVNRESILKKKKEEQLKKMKQWDEMIPDGAFTDTPVKENITGRHIDKKEQEIGGNTSSLEY